MPSPNSFNELGTYSEPICQQTLVYWSALDPLFEAGAADVLELEPQTLWTEQATPTGFAYRLNDEKLEAIARRPQAKLLHGVGQPFGAAVDDPIAYLPLLRRMADRLRPAWVSEHLSFNRVADGDRVRECGFLLPPPQSPAAVRVAAANIGRYAEALGRPTAFETGVNYFQPVVGELDDGGFFAAVATRADCGILLDLHNLWCNERNGRQRVTEALAQMPLDRVWEVHLAGGSMLDGYALDAHSRGIAPELLELAAAVVPRLPRLGALVFEILPQHLAALGLDGVQRELEALRSLWRLRRPRRVRSRRWGAADATPASAADRAQLRADEIAIAAALNGDVRQPLAFDAGSALLRRLIFDQRSASLTRGLRYTLTALLVALGPSETESLLSQYCREYSPSAYVARESWQFTCFLAAREAVLSGVPHLAEVLAFERALLDASLYGTATELAWSIDPTELLEALDRGALPPRLPAVTSRMTIGV